MSYLRLTALLTPPYPDSGGMQGTLGGFSCTATGSTSWNTANLLLPALLVDAEGGTLGRLSATLPALRLLARGGSRAAGTLGVLSCEATGYINPSGSLAKKLGDLELFATGDSINYGSLEKTLPGLKISAAGTAVKAGNLSESLGSLSVSATGYGPNIGTLDATLGGLTLAFIASGYFGGGKARGAYLGRFSNYILEHTR